MPGQLPKLVRCYWKEYNLKASSNDSHQILPPNGVVPTALSWYQRRYYRSNKFIKLTLFNCSLLPFHALWDETSIILLDNCTHYACQLLPVEY